MSSLASRRPLVGSKILLYLIAFRICNALLLRTFFQPDEYFQSLEPAWAIAFGSDSGAWLTWEWKQRLRSSLHPYFFAAVYRLADSIAYVFTLSPSMRSDLLLAAPKVVQAIFAGLTDYYTVKLAGKASYDSEDVSSTALFLTIMSPWQYFCSTRTLSNSIETTLTAMALCAWPFESSAATKDQRYRQLCTAFALAALATILRPTNIIIWLVISLYTAGHTSKFKLVKTFQALILETKAALIAGLSILAVSVFADRVYYQQWTLPPLNFLHFNLVQSLAVFYGRNRPDYYLTEGLPLLLTTTLPLAAYGLYQATTTSQFGPPSILRPLALSIIIFVALMSTIAHKEVRFIYPLLPALHALSATPASHFFFPAATPALSSRQRALRKTALTAFVAANIAFAVYISSYHQRGVLDVMHYLRHEYETLYLDTAAPTTTTEIMTVLFLMPCHSTPWRSHLIHPGIEARALSCEPPLGLVGEERERYRDEADVFYDDPGRWMRGNFEGQEYVVFFGQLEGTMREVLGKEEGAEKGGEGEKFQERENGLYGEVWRGFNSHWHDDWRRVGDVIVWKRGVRETQRLA